MINFPDPKSQLDPTDWLVEHGDYLYGYALVRVRNASAAEDLLQETLLAAMSSYQRHEGRSSERTWLVGILRHKVIDYFRRVARTPEFQLSNEEGELDWFENDGAWRGHWREDQAPINWPVDAVQLLESEEFWETFKRCLARLSPQMAIAFTLREIDGLTSEEICQILDVRPNNLWVILHRSRAKLRHLLEAEWFRGCSPASPSGNNDPSQLTMEMPAAPEFTYRAVAA
ncbi:MAG TPA: sigma-70 family RNA polymerase sigma factor [Pyrinomonadaceae bacterium]|nr:sigma-70 family RNA polymerase sigma factor [Pyrinomonadaceae bacterium]